MLDRDASLLRRDLIACSLGTVNRLLQIRHLHPEVSDLLLQRSQRGCWSRRRLKGRHVVLSPRGIMALFASSYFDGAESAASKEACPSRRGFERQRGALDRTRASRHARAGDKRAQGAFQLSCDLSTGLNTS